VKNGGWSRSWGNEKDFVEVKERKKRWLFQTQWRPAVSRDDDLWWIWWRTS
jgi:hypothetical protein